jgi:hypothetical protein
VIAFSQTGVIVSRLPAIIDNRYKNTVQEAILRILPNLIKTDAAIGAFRINIFFFNLYMSSE